MEAQERRAIALQAAMQMGPRGFQLIEAFDHYIETGELEFDNVPGMMRPPGPPMNPQA